MTLNIIFDEYVVGKPTFLFKLIITFSIFDCIPAISTYVSGIIKLLKMS